jgi:hypothetical protein
VQIDADRDPVPDPAYHFDADPDVDPDPYFLFDAAPDPDIYLMRVRIRMRIQVTKKMRIPIHNTVLFLRASFSVPGEDITAKHIVHEVIKLEVKTEPADDYGEFPPRRNKKPKKTARRQEESLEIKQEPRSPSNHRPVVSIKREAEEEEDSPQKKRRQRHDSDELPPRKQRHDSDESPPRRRQRHDSDESPPRKQRHDSDESPPRKQRRSVAAAEKSAFFSAGF